MTTELQIELNEEEREGFSELLSLCNERDRTCYGTEPDADFYYLLRNEEFSDTGVNMKLLAVLYGYRLGERQGEQEKLELRAFTHPELRRLGLFRQLYAGLRDDLRGFRFVVSVLDSTAPAPGETAPDGSDKGDFPLSERSEAGASGKKKPVASKQKKHAARGILRQETRLAEDTRGTLEALHAEKQYEELYLRKKLSFGILNPGTVEESYGELRTKVFSEDTLYLYGVLVYRSLQGQGYGHRLLERLEQVGEGPYDQLLLQVRSSNAAAYHLYLKHGFQVTERISYFLLS